MAVYLQPGLVFPPSPPWRPPPSPLPTRTNNSSTSLGGVTAGISIPVVGIFLLVLACMCSHAQRHHSPANAGDDAAAAAPTVAVPPPPLVPEPWDNDEQQLRGAREREDGRPRCASPTAGLPSFTYTLSVKHNVTGSSEEEAATCSVCLGALQLGETVRLLPVCLHLYHVECIDPWLDAHWTCPICRSGTDPTMDGGPLPPV